MKLIELEIFENNGAFIGESMQICINSNIAEIAKTPVQFWGDTPAQVIEQVGQYARAKFGAGKIRLI
jgi:hypothetical protein